MSLTTLLPEAQRLAGAGFSIVPVKADKLPLGSWTRNQQTIDPPEALPSRFNSSVITGFAAVTGEVSGGLLSVDFDLDKKGEALEPFDLEKEFVDPWFEAVSAVIDPASIPRQRTGSGGFQFFVRCPDPGGNVKLAKVPANNKQSFHAVIETRGQGGYALLPPSLHPSGNLYAWQHLDLTDVPTLTSKQVTALLDAARALDRMPLEVAEQRRLTKSYEQRQGEQDEIIRAFNAEYNPADILGRNGYTLVKGKYLSPDSTSGNPGVTVFKDAPLIYSHHGDALGDGRAHDTFDVFAYLEHGEDKKAAYEVAGRELGLWREGGSVGFVNAKQPDAPPDTEPWEPPLPLPTELPEVPTLPAELIPDPLREWIDDAAERTNVHREFIAVPALVSVGALIGRSVGIYPKQRDSWLVVPNVWGAIVGSPSVLKSPSIAEGTAPLRRLAAQAREAFEAAEANREADAEVLKLQIGQLKKSGTAKKGDPAAIKSDLTALLQELKDLEDAGTEKRYLTNDATIEKLGELLIQNPRGLLSLHDELMGLLKTFDKPGRENERPFYLTAWNGTDSTNVDRIGRGSLYVPALTLSILGGVQPGKLRSYIYGTLEGGEGDDGLLQRFQLIVWPDKPPAWENVDRYPKTDAKNRAFEVYRKLDQLDPGEVERIEPGDIPALRFTPQAQNLFNGWRSDLMNRIRTPELERTPAFMAHLAKYPSLCASLALIFHLIDVVDGKASGRVSVDATEMAVDWCAFLELHAKKMYAPELNTAVLAAHVLAEKIRQREVEDAQPLRDVQRRQWTGLKSAEQLESALNVLKRCNWLKVKTLEPGKQGGRPSDVLRLHPELRGRNGGV